MPLSLNICVRQNNIIALFKVIDLLDSSSFGNVFHHYKTLTSLILDYNLLTFNLQRLGNHIIITNLEFLNIELFVHIAKSLQIEHFASNHETRTNHIVWVSELTMLDRTCRNGILRDCLMSSISFYSKYFYF